MSAIQRESAYLTVTIAAGEAESESFQFYPYGGGSILVPSGWTSADIGFMVAVNPGNNYYPLYDEDGNIVRITAISTSIARWYNIPLEVFGARHIKLWSNTTAADTNQGTEKDLVITLKA